MQDMIDAQMESELQCQFNREKCCMLTKEIEEQFITAVQKQFNQGVLQTLWFFPPQSETLALFKQKYHAEADAARLAQLVEHLYSNTPHIVDDMLPWEYLEAKLELLQKLIRDKGLSVEARVMHICPHFVDPGSFVKWEEVTSVTESKTGCATIYKFVWRNEQSR